MRKFLMTRSNDESGVSGTGEVLEGVVFKTGACVVSWLTATSSLGVFNTYDHFLKVHVLSHPTNGTIIMFDDGVKETY